jgi:hypothetical protein
MEVQMTIAAKPASPAIASHSCFFNTISLGVRCLQKTTPDGIRKQSVRQERMLPLVGVG